MRDLNNTLLLWLRSFEPGAEAGEGGAFRRALRSVQDFRVARSDIQVALCSTTAKSSRADLPGDRLDASMLFRQAAGPSLRGDRCSVLLWAW